jgi:hypothetical protein
MPKYIVDMHGFSEYALIWDEESVNDKRNMRHASQA